MASEPSPSVKQHDTLGALGSAGNELDLLTLSASVDDDLIDASLDSYQYDSMLPSLCTEDLH